MNRAPKHFDLTKVHLTDPEFYRAPKARTPYEIERRRGLPPGTTGAEFQRNGIWAAAHVVKSGRSEEDLAYNRKVLAPTGINTDWMGYTRFVQQMRNVRHVPQVATDPLFGPEFAPDMRSEAGYELEDAGFLAGRLVVAIANHRPNVATIRKNVARRVGNASLKLACSQLGDLDGVSTFEAQSMARQECLGALADSRSLGAEIGTAPTFAQLADPDSPLSVYIRRTAPTGVYDAFDEATEMFRMSV